MIEPKKVYVVARGEYSDYHIVAIFSEKALAEKFNEEYGDRNEVEEYTLDAQKSRLEAGYLRYALCLDGEGNLLTHYAVIEDNTERGPVFELNTYWDEKANIPALRAECWAKSEEQALKIATEHLIQIKASGAWAKHVLAMAAENAEREEWRRQRILKDVAGTGPSMPGGPIGPTGPSGPVEP